MATIRDFISKIGWKIDTTSQAGRITGYKTDGSISPIYAVRNHYRASTAVAFAAAAGTAPFFAIQGSANKIVRIISVRFTGMTLTTVAYQTTIVQKRSTATTGGTATALVQVPNDSTHPAGTLSLLNVYTVAPTAGTLVGTIGSSRFLAADTTPTTLMTEDHEILFYKDHEDGLVLRGITEGVTISFASAPATAVTMALEIVWTEADT